MTLLDLKRGSSARKKFPHCGAKTEHIGFKRVLTADQCLTEVHERLVEIQIKSRQTICCTYNLERPLSCNNYDANVTNVPQGQSSRVTATATWKWRRDLADCGNHQSANDSQMNQSNYVNIVD